MNAIVLLTITNMSNRNVIRYASWLFFIMERLLRWKASVVAWSPSTLPYRPPKLIASCQHRQHHQRRHGLPIVLRSTSGNDNDADEYAVLKEPLFNADENNNNEKEEETIKIADRSSNAATQQQQQQQQQQQRFLTSRELMNALGTSPRRIFLSLTSATGIALAGNLFGVTSNLLKAIPEETVEASGLDTYFPRGDFKRYNGRDYTFVIPKEWVADTFVALAKAQQNVRPLDYSMKRNGGGMGTLPDAAFGPPGRLNSQGVSEQGDTNVSVIVTKVSSFSLKGTLGTDPKVAAETLLAKVIAPEGSSRVATLISAEEDTLRNVYQFEYDLVRQAKPEVPLRAVSVITGKPDAFLTLTVVAPKSDWETNDLYNNNKLRKIAQSFHLR